MAHAGVDHREQHEHVRGDREPVDATPEQSQGPLRVTPLGDEAELGFRALAYSGDTNDPTSLLDLTRGTLQLPSSATATSTTEAA